MCKFSAKGCDFGIFCTYAHSNEEIIEAAFIKKYVLVTV